MFTMFTEEEINAFIADPHAGYVEESRSSLVQFIYTYFCCCHPDHAYYTYNREMKIAQEAIDSNCFEKAKKHFKIAADILDRDGFSRDNKARLIYGNLVLAGSINRYKEYMAGRLNIFFPEGNSSRNNKPKEGFFDREKSEKAEARRLNEKQQRYFQELKEREQQDKEHPELPLLREQNELLREQNKLLNSIDATVFSSYTKPKGY